MSTLTYGNKSMFVDYHAVFSQSVYLYLVKMDLINVALVIDTMGLLANSLEPMTSLLLSLVIRFTEVFQSSKKCVNNSLMDRHISSGSKWLNNTYVDPIIVSSISLRPYVMVCRSLWRFSSDECGLATHIR
jgi:hypothetical protein